MLSLTSSTLLLSALFSFASVIFILRNNSKNPVNIYLSSFLMFLGVWASILISFESAKTEEKAILFGNIAYIAALGIGTCLYLFSLVFPESKKISLGRVTIIFVPFLVFLGGLLINPHFLIREIVVIGGSKIVTIDGFGWFTFSIFFVSLYVLGVNRLWETSKKATLFVKKQLRIIIISLCITGVGGMFYNLILASPFLQNFEYLWSGPLFSTAVAGAIIYSIFRFHLFNVKMFLAEVFIFLLWVATFLRVLVYVTEEQEFAINVMLFLLSFILGMLLLRSISKEIESRELLEVQAADLAKANEQLKSLDKLKSEFISLASHQLRSPLTVIKGYASTLTDGIVGDLTPKQTEIVRHIYTSAQGLASVVEDFLNVTKIEQGGMKYAFAETDLSLIAKDLVSDMKIAAEDKKLKLSLEIDEQCRYSINADSVKLKQVFLNLIDNSIKYTKEGYIIVRLFANKDTVTFEVTDSGVGISEETKAKLFTKFTRGEGGILNTGGSGLGLYLAHEIIEAHQGSIEVVSDGTGRGSTFKVILPLRSTNQ